METTILELVTKYGFNTLVIASLVFMLTGLIKKPIKAIAKKMKDGTVLTKYITFLPIILGFGVTALYKLIVTKSIVFDGNYMTLWLTSSSLSLAIYAISEKFIPSKKKILSGLEVKQNEELIEKIKEVVLPNTEIILSKPIEEPKQEQEKPIQKILLRGNGNGETIDVKKEQL